MRKVRMFAFTPCITLFTVSALSTLSAISMAFSGLWTTSISSRPRPVEVSSLITFTLLNCVNFAFMSICATSCSISVWISSRSSAPRMPLVADTASSLILCTISWSCPIIDSTKLCRFLMSSSFMESRFICSSIESIFSDTASPAGSSADVLMRFPEDKRFSILLKLASPIFAWVSI